MDFRDKAWRAVRKLLLQLGEKWVKGEEGVSLRKTEKVNLAKMC